jgi:uncharacterized membrane protein
MEKYEWLFKALHTFGFAVWVGTTLALLQILSAHEKSGQNAGLTMAERPLGRLLDIGATFALAGGILLLVVTKSRGELWPMKQGWMHAKLLAIVLFLGIHGFLRSRIKKFRQGKTVAVPFPVVALAWLIPVAIVFLAIYRPF